MKICFQEIGRGGRPLSNKYCVPKSQFIKANKRDDFSPYGRAANAIARRLKPGQCMTMTISLGQQARICGSKQKGKGRR